MSQPRLLPEQQDEVSGESAEHWKPIPGYEGTYEVSNQGHVRRLHKRGTTKQLLETPTKNGYLAVTLHRNDGGRKRYIHQLVLETFDPSPKPGLDVRHKFGGKQDNRLANLHWGTRAENMADEVEGGRNLNAAKTECVNGHPFNDENTRWRTSKSTGRPRRECIQCGRDRARAQKARRRETKRAACPQ